MSGGWSSDVLGEGIGGGVGEGIGAWGAVEESGVGVVGRDFDGDDAEFFEGELSGALFGGFFGVAPGGGEGASVDGDADFEAFGVIGSAFVDEFIGGGGAEHFLAVLLEEGLVVLLVGGGGEGQDVLVHMLEDEVFGGVVSAVDEECGDDGFEGAGGEGGGSFGAADHAFSDEEEVGESDGVGDFGAGAAGDDGGFEFGEVAFEVLGVELVEVVADDHAEDGVAEEFEPFIGVATVIGDGGVGEGFGEELVAKEAVAEDGFALGKEFFGDH